MDQKDFQQFLDEKYQTELRLARRRALFHQRLAKGLEWGLIVLSTITTILLVISSFRDELSIRLTTGVCSTIVTAIAASMRTLRTQEKWSFYQKLGYDLENEYYLYLAKEGIYQKFKDKEAQFVKRVLSLLEDANQKMPQRTR